MSVLHVDPVSGASGDMLLGALLDAGADDRPVRDLLGTLDLGEWRMETAPVTRAGLGALSVTVVAREDGVVRTWANVRELLATSDLPEPVRTRAVSTFRRLAEAEARVHRTDPERVHFHEVGAVDAVVDIVGVCAGFHLLGAERVTCAPVPLGTGMTRGSHGPLPLPAPAVLELLAGAPVFSPGISAELCTPTGAALLAEWVDEWTALPALAVERVGYGAGSRDLDERPNVLRLIVGRPVAGAGGTTAALLLEATLDDLPGELVPPVLDALRAAGADDAWARPVVMKKGRPGLEVACIGPPGAAETLRRVLFRETTTLGVRGRLVDKWTLERDWVTVEVAGQPVRLKIGRLDGRVMNVAPEFEDCAAAAAASGLALKEVFARARAAWAPSPDPVPEPPASA